MAPLIPAIAQQALGDVSPPLTPKEECEERGWIWDEANQSCNNPDVRPLPERLQPQPEPTPQPPSPPGSIVRNAETGEVSGFINSEGNFVASTRQEAEAVLQRQQAKTQPFPGEVSAEGFQIAQRETARKFKLASQVGQIDFALASELDDMGINWKEAFLAGTGKLDIVGIGTAAAAGAFAGGAAAIPTAGLGPAAVAAITAGGTAINQFYKGVQENIKAQKGDLLSGKRTELKQRQRAMMNYISAANANPAGADEMVLAYNIEKSLVRSDYLSLSHEASEALTLFGGQDGTPQLIAYEIFFESVEPSLDLRMEEAVLKPDPTRAYLSVEDFE